MVKQHRLVPFLLLACVSFSSCQSYLEDVRIALGTVCSIKIWETKDKKLLEGCFDILNNIENQMSVNIEGSDLSKLRESAGKNPVVLAEDTIFLIEKAKEYYSFSGGLFDISIGPLVSLWAIGSGGISVPDLKKIDEAKSLSGIDEVQIDKQTNEVYLERSGMAIDLGAIGKGYASDRVAAYLRDNGIKKAIINFGGNSCVIGRKSADRKWAIGIQDPYSDRGNSIGRVFIEDKVVITSGPYERFFIQDGARYHHILNPFTGFPVENNLQAVAVIADNGTDGDALSTSLFSLGLAKGLEKAEALENAEAIFITSEREVYLTSGVMENFELFDNNYKLANNSSIISMQ